MNFSLRNPLSIFLVFGICANALAGEALRVSSFSTVLSEIAAAVGGDTVKVYAHVKPGMDPHGFQPKPADLRVVASAQLVLMSGKQMEPYIGKLKEATGSGGIFLDIGEQLPSLHGPIARGQAATKEVDPHWWHSIANVRRATKIICDTMTALRPAERAVFKENSERYLSELDALKHWANAKVAELPRAGRRLVTSHDAFQYFARDFGFTIYAIEGITTADQPSAEKVTRIIEEIRLRKVKAVFPESIENPKVLREITRESGAAVGPMLYADGLGEGAAATYAGMYRHNVAAIVDFLK